MQRRKKRNTKNEKARVSNIARFTRYLVASRRYFNQRELNFQFNYVGEVFVNFNTPVMFTILRQPIWIQGAGPEYLRGKRTYYVHNGCGSTSAFYAFGGTRDKMSERRRSIFQYVGNYFPNAKYARVAAAAARAAFCTIEFKFIRIACIVVKILYLTEPGGHARGTARRGA